MFLFNVICISIVFLLLGLAAYEDYKTGEVEHLYIITNCLLILGFIFSYYTDLPYIGLKLNLYISIIIFISNYTIYVISNALNRSGWGGADVMILTSISLSFGVYSLFSIALSSIIASIYTILKAIIEGKKIVDARTRFLPFVFISNFIIILLSTMYIF